jgi:glycosyltransferase involved in cell wall biosynthesis
MLEQVRRRAAEFDVLHFHVDLLQMPLVQALQARSVTTLHGRLDLPDLAACYAAFPDVPLVSISNDQRRHLPAAPRWLGTVHHGLPPDLLPFNPHPRGDYLAFLGRISPEKGPDRAIEIAARAGLPLKIAAKVDKADRHYWAQVIEPLLKQHDADVEFVGEIDERRKAQFLGNARALLFPIDWPEPFGLVMIESMACGTPVIAFDRGSVPEVIDDGVTGRIVDNVDEAVRALDALPSLDREAVREGFERRFTVERMALDYARLYRRLQAPRRAAIAARNGSVEPGWSFDEIA